MTEAFLIYAGSEHDSNILYATGFVAGDPFTFIQVGKEKIMLISDLEYGRAKDESKADIIMRMSEIDKELKGKGVEKPGLSDAITYVLKSRSVNKVIVPPNFWFQ